MKDQKTKISTALLLCLIVLFISSCNRTTSKDLDTIKKYNFDWLLGDWQRTNDEEGNSTFEHWNKMTNSNYDGLGYTLMDSDTIFKENMEILTSLENVELKVSHVNEKPVFFKLTSQSINSATFENPAHDFPNKIEYMMRNDSLHAVVSGSDMEIPFQFIRLKKRN